MKPSEIEKAIQEKNVTVIKELLDNKTLMIKDGKLCYASADNANSLIGYYSKLEQTKKRLLNSLYGSILNVGCRFFDKRIGQSTTLTGRQVVKYMSEKVNEIITGEADYRGKAMIYNDSVTGDTIIKTSSGECKIEDLYK